MSDESSAFEAMLKRVGAERVDPEEQRISLTAIGKIPGEEEEADRAFAERMTGRDRVIRKAGDPEPEGEPMEPSEDFGPGTIPVSDWIPYMPADASDYLDRETPIYLNDDGTIRGSLMIAPSEPPPPDDDAA